MKTEVENRDYEIEIDGIEYYVYFDIIWSWENNGIGGYEYHGQKCYDQGSWSSSVEDVVIHKVYHIDGGDELEISDELKEKMIVQISKTAKY
jgi:hypothetical protein